MKIYESKFKIYLFLLFLFVITLLLLPFSGRIVKAESNEDMKDITVREMEEDRMKQITIPSPTPDHSRDRNIPIKDTETSIKDSNRKSEKTSKNADNKKSIKTSKNTDSKRDIRTSKNTDNEKGIKASKNTGNKKNMTEKLLYLSDSFLHLTVGESRTLGLSTVSIADAREQISSKKAGEQTVNADKLNSDTDILIISDADAITGKKDDKNILYFKDQTITANRTGIAVILFSLKSNSSVKTSCTVRITER